MTDYISKSALISHIEREYRQWGENYDTQQILGDIEDFPVVDAEPVQHGKWLLSSNGWVERCSLCGEIYLEDNVKPRNYCPHCGAKMDKK